MASLRKFTICSLAGILTFACGQSGQNSRPQSQGYQSTVEGKAIVISLNQDFSGSSLFTRVDKAAANRPVFTGINLDSSSDSRGHFPDYAEKWVNSSAVSFKVKVCDGFTASIDPSNCLNDNTLPDYFAGSDPAAVTKAVLEALQLLTYGDLVPGCYLEKLRATEAFETTITSVSVPLARARVRQVLSSSLFATCKDVKRSLWSTTAPCNNVNLNGTYQSLRNAIVDKAQTNASIRNTYADRYRLALRLGVDEFKDFQEKSDLFEINPFPSSLDTYASDFKCINANLGDNSCIWGPSLIPGLKSGTSRHFYTTVDKDLQLILGQDQNLNGDKNYAELLWAAVRLAKATSLQPAAKINRLEAQSPALNPSCETVAAYALGKYSLRSRYAAEPALFESPGDPTFIGPTDNIIFKQGNEEFPAPENGDRLPLITNDWRCDGGICPLQASRMGSELGQARIRLYRSIHATPTKIFTAKTLTAGSAVLLDSRQMQELVLAENENAAIFFDICPKATPCSSEDSVNWQVWRSWRIHTSRLEPLQPFIVHCKAGDFGGSTGTTMKALLALTNASATCEEKFLQLYKQKELILFGQDLTDLEPLRNLTNLTSLFLSSNQLTNVEPLRNLTNLTTLYLSFNQLTSVEPLRNLTNLTSLVLTSNQLTSVEPLRNLTNLTSLDLYGNQLTSVEPLRNLTNLTSLHLSFNLTSDEPLRNLTNLTSLDLSSSRLTSVEPLRNLTNLTSLSLHNNQLTSVEPLRNLTNLTSLELGFNQLTSVEPLRNLTNLTSLYLFDNQLTSVESLRNLTSLKRLDLSHNQLSSVEPLRNLTNLTSLDLSSSQLTSVELLRNLTNLTRLALSFNLLTSVEPLRNLTNLTTLYLNGSHQLTSVEPLRNLTNLTSLDLSSSQLTSVEPLQNLTNLRSLQLSYNQLTSVEPLRNLTNLTSLELDENPIKNSTAACPTNSANDELNRFCRSRL